MKKVLFLLVAAASLMLFACDKQGVPKKNTLSFKSVSPQLVDGKFVLELEYSGEAPQQALSVPVVFSGDAKKDVDFTVSAEAFVLGGSAPVTKVELTPKNFGKEVIATISAPEGYDAGAIMESRIKFVIGSVSFSSNKYDIREIGVVAIQLLDNEDKALKITEEQAFTFEVDTDKSTAVEGEHFAFKSAEKKIVVKKKNNSAQIEIEVKKLEAGKDKLVLKLSENPSFRIGQYGKATIIFKGSVENELGGTYKCVSSLSFEEQKGIWFDYVDDSDKDAYPEFNAEDQIKIDLSTHKFIPTIKSRFKNFFIGESEFAAAPDKKIKNFNGTKKPLELFLFKNVNRNFSENFQSDDKEAYVGLEFVKNEKTQEDILVIHILDYKPTSFFGKIVAASGMFGDEKPVATMSGLDIEYRFKKI